MIPRIAAGGRSFKGAYRYYGHDKESETRERVAWTHTENMITDDPDKAWKVMAWTAKEQERLKMASGQRASGRKLEKPVFSYSLAWHPEQDPDRDHMLETALESLRVLGLSEYETLVIAHRDEPQRHVHVIVNRVHPITGKAATISHSKRKLSDFALNHERKHGKIYCVQRQDNQRKRERGERTMYRDPVIQSAWRNSDTGRSFVAALADKDYVLAQGRKRVVVVDPHGQVHNPVRHIEGIRTKDLKDKLADLDGTKLPDATEVSREVQSQARESRQEQKKKEQASAEEVNRLQDRQMEERADVFNRHHNRIESERTRLNEYYGIGETEEKIEQLTGRTARAGFWQWLTGEARRDRSRLEELRKGLANARERLGEKVAYLEKDRDRAMKALEERQSTERHLLKEHGPDALEAWRNRDRVNRASQEMERTHAAPRMRR